MRIDVFVFVALTLIAAPAAAQLTPEQARAKADKATVTVAVEGGVWKGRLLDLDAETVTIQPANGSPRTLPLSGVLRIETKKRDSLGNGALIGALVVLVECAVVCGQGLDSGDDLGGVIIFNTMVGAGIGAAIDAGHTANLSLYKRPNPTPARKSPGLFFTVRF